MENGEIPDTLTCLKMAAAGENEEHTSMYPRMAAEAKEEGFNQVAALFTMVAAIEKDHEERYKAAGRQHRSWQGLRPRDRAGLAVPQLRFRLYRPARAGQVPGLRPSAELF